MKVEKIILQEKSKVKLIYRNGEEKLKIARGILMKPWGIKAMLEGIKTVTRRIIIPQPEHKTNGITEEPGTLKTHLEWLEWKGKKYKIEFDEKLPKLCPKGQPGDLLYIREPFWEWGCWNYGKDERKWKGTGIFFAAYKFPLTSPLHSIKYMWRKKPSIHMPRSAARYWLMITDIKVERLQDISDDDCYDEGINKFGHETEDGEDYYWKVPTYWKNPDGKIVKELYVDHFRNAFFHLWNSINSNRKDKTGNIFPYSWEKNPWVWVIYFKHIYTVEKCGKQ